MVPRHRPAAGGPHTRAPARRKRRSNSLRPLRRDRGDPILFGGSSMGLGLTSSWGPDPEQSGPGARRLDRYHQCLRKRPRVAASFGADLPIENTRAGTRWCGIFRRSERLHSWFAMAACVRNVGGHEGERGGSERGHLCLRHSKLPTSLCLEVCTSVDTRDGRGPLILGDSSTTSGLAGGLEFGCDGRGAAPADKLVCPHASLSRLYVCMDTTAHRVRDSQPRGRGGTLGAVLVAGALEFLLFEGLREAALRALHGSA
mmetsp:Transcript_84571/g.185673  ORF Transcript_84571/g.185673 Transcript_84571/m.185673 type:complete len:258 (-) Transcript_84571:153-926(-)